MGTGDSLSKRELWELRAEIEDFHTAYCAVLDSDRVMEWPDFFTEDALYRVTGRDNWDAGLPVGLIYCEGRAMLRDRAFAIENTEMFAPRYLRHMVTNIRVEAVPSDGAIASEANYLLLETLVDADTKILQAGRYVDRFQRVDGALRLRERHCVYDSLIVDNALIMPV